MKEIRPTLALEDSARYHGPCMHRPGSKMSAAFWTPRSSGLSGEWSVFLARGEVVGKAVFDRERPDALRNALTLGLAPLAKERVQFVQVGDAEAPAWRIAAARPLRSPRRRAFRCRGPACRRAARRLSGWPSPRSEAGTDVRIPPGSAWRPFWRCPEQTRPVRR